MPSALHGGVSTTGNAELVGPATSTDPGAAHSGLANGQRGRVDGTWARREAGKTAPDQLITYQATDRQAGVPRCVPTDVTVHETVTAALVRNRTTVRSKLHNEARLKRRLHEEPSRAAGCDFVPLVFASLGTMHPDPETAKFLDFTNVDIDELERLLQRIGSGRRMFTANVLDGFSCALARGNASARILFRACAALQWAHVAQQHNRAAADEHG